jgi:hypothetical protein
LNYHIQDGKLVVLVALDQAVLVDGKELFAIKANTMKAGFISEMITQSRQGLSEIYTALTARSASLEWNRSVSTWSVKQNSPNPWTDKTSIVCNSDKAGTVSYKLMDATGKLIYAGEQKVNVGENNIEIKSDVLNGKTGVILYEIRFGNEVANGKMIRIQ